MDFVQINVGDILRLKVDERYRVWRVVGVYYGVVHQESLVHLEPLDIRASNDGQIMIPVEIYTCIKNGESWPNSTSTTSKPTAARRIK